MADDLDGLDEEFKRSEEYASKLLDLVQEIAKLNSKNIGFVEAEDADRIDEIIKQYPELQRYYMLEQKDFDIDEFMDYCETLEKAHLYFQWLNNDLSEFIDYDDKVNNSNGIQYFNKELSDLNEEIQRATGSSENFIEKYKGISDALTDGKLDYMSAFKNILEKEFPDYDVYNVGDGFQLLPKTKKDISDIGEQISKSEAKVISFSEKLKEMANTSINKDVLLNNPIVESQNDIQEELKETQVEVEKTENKYQSLLDVAKNELDKDKQNTNYYDGHTIETKAFSNFIFGEQFKRWGRHDVWSKEYEELCNIIDNTEKELQEGSIGFEKAIDRMVSAYQKYDSIAKIDVGGFDYLNSVC